jgi:hypothetical protein
MKSYPKDPDARTDYGRDWSPWLNGDTIVNSEWIAPAGINVDASAFTATETIVWLVGGTAGQRYQITNRIYTAGGRIEDNTISIRMRHN